MYNSKNTESEIFTPDHSSHLFALDELVESMKSDMEQIERYQIEILRIHEDLTRIEKSISDIK